MLEKALKANLPEIFNSDQGSQFTNSDFTCILEDNGIRISMDSRGRVYEKYSSNVSGSQLSTKKYISRITQICMKRRLV